MFDDVMEFHKTILNIEPSTPHLMTDSLMQHRMGFLMEELLEFEFACFGKDTVKAADALADLVYVALGTAYHMGLPFNDIWAAVQKANMAKVPGFTKRGMPNDAKKPDGWQGPEADILSAVLKASDASKP